MTESIFHELDEEQNEIRAIVVTKEMLETGQWGDPNNWVDHNTFIEMLLEKAKEEESDG